MSDFGKRLRHYRLKTVDPNSDPPKPLTQEELAGLMGEMVSVHEKMISFWETGTRKISHRRRDLQIGLVKVLHTHGGIQTADEANGLLLLGRYDPLSAEECQDIDAKWLVAPPAISPTALQAVPPHGSLWQMVYAWLDAFFRWSDADDHARMSWAGMVIWSLGVVNGRLTTDHLLTVLTACLLWIAAIWLLVPALQWPLTPQPVLHHAVGRLLAGWFSLPLLLALFTRADGLVQTKHAQPRLLLLKFTGALVGFNLSVLLLLIVAAGWYYFMLPPLL
ncbi:MAG: helix-turn-helix transcriptional regulator, partial [Anaerolineales bacterium]|nr:helix-turn-helix transcriptional regulator [Anaerolineales bacterium]